MMNTFLFGALCLLAQFQEATPRTWEVDGVTREALVFAPKKVDGKAPLVFDFHGHGGTAKHAARTHRIHEAWPQAVVVYMQGLNTPGKLTDPEGKKPGWQTGPADQKDRDLKFFDAVLASLRKDYPIDEQRIFATGHSNGGAFTYLLWAKRGDTFAAFAPVAAAAGLYFVEAKPKPLFHAASEKDALVTIAMQQRTLDRVKKLNGCGAAGEVWAKGCLRYSSKNGPPVVIYLHDEGHKYPETTPALIVKFFQEQTQKRTRSPLIDAHMHVWSDDPVKFPFAHPYDPKFMPPKIPASLDRVVKEMDAHGITHCVLVQTISHGWDNRYLFHCLKAEPKRFRGQGLIDPTDPNVAKNLALVMKEPGMTGVRFSPMYYQGKDEWLNSKANDALWQKAEELGAIFNFFIASEQLPKLEDMVRRHPRVKIVIDHLARVDLEKKDPEPEINKLLALAKYSNVYVKVSELMILSPSKKHPYRDAFPLVKKVYNAFGPERLLWGTGFPGDTRAQAGRPSLDDELALIEREIPFFTDADRSKILGQNAARLWGFTEVDKTK